jgi:hypothetical protein
MVKKKTNKSSGSKKIRPVGVSILSVLAYIGAVFTIIAGLAMLFGASAIASFISTKIPTLPANLAGLGLVLIGIIFIIFAVIDYFIGRGLWKGQNWARILVIILMALSLLGSLRHVLTNIVGIIIDILIIWYLGFNKSVINYFR